jgi:hypothetical protein
MRTGGSSGAAAAIGRAQAVSGLARQAGCDLDEARELLALRSGYRCAAEVGG